MIEILTRCQACQAQVFARNDGYSFHVDASSNDALDTGDYRLSISVTLFCGHTIEESWDFYAGEDGNEQIAEEMEEYIKNLK